MPAQTPPIKWVMQDGLPGNRATFTVGDLTFRATIEPDYGQSPREWLDADDPDDAARLAAWERGDFCMVGVVVTAGIAIAIPGKIGRTIELGSASLWGIESDSGLAYLTEIARELSAEAAEEADTTLATLAQRAA